ncbi:hypothetical protein F5Y16DRAFT_392530 [Xylariaceae sp. FL0255]|nr:hypothetical protein F5Y16DRAFT_392530 [Xylariaceae sp. FL0255]
MDKSFQNALLSLRKHVPEQFCRCSGQCASIEDVIQHIKAAEAKYSSRTGGKAQKWVGRLSSKIHFYSQVLDVLIQQYPEYVSLAWGAFKLVFMGVINHEALVKELAKAMSLIADAVKHVETQHLLHQTPQLAEYTTELYTHIMKFAVRAVEWYQKGRIAHTVAAFTSPFQLKFRDIVDDIYETTRKIDRWALTVSSIEIRQMHKKVIETQKALETAQSERQEVYRLIAEVRGFVIQYRQMSHTGLIGTNQNLSQIQFSQIMSFLSQSSIPRADLVRQSYVVKRNRRRKYGLTSMGSQSWIPTIQGWGEAKTFAQIVIQGSFKTRKLIRDFAVDTIDLIAEANIPVIWALDPNLDLTAENNFNASDVLKYLTCQILQLSNGEQTEKQATLSAARFQSAVTESQWVELLAMALQGIKNQIYIIVDLNLIGRAGGTFVTWLGYFSSIAQTMMLRDAQGIIKVAFLSTTMTSSDAIPTDTKVLRFDKVTSGRIQKRSN